MRGRRRGGSGRRRWPARSRRAVRRTGLPSPSSTRPVTMMRSPSGSPSCWRVRSASCRRAGRPPYRARSARRAMRGAGRAVLRRAQPGADVFGVEERRVGGAERAVRDPGESGLVRRSVHARDCSACRDAPVCMAPGDRSDVAGVGQWQAASIAALYATTPVARYPPARATGKRRELADDQGDARSPRAAAERGVQARRARPRATSRRGARRLDGRRSELR